MTETSQLSVVWRRAADANMRYYRAVSELTIGHLRAVTATVGDVWRTAATATHPAERTSDKAETRAQPAMVLESEAGGAAVGAFVVENGLGRTVSAPLVASPLVASGGREVRPAIAFDPEVVLLEPGEQVLVRVAAAVDESLEPDVGYRGELTVPGLPGTRIPIVVRRRIAVAAKPAATRSRSKRAATDPGSTA